MSGGERVPGMFEQEAESDRDLLGDGESGVAPEKHGWGEGAVHVERPDLEEELHKKAEQQGGE